MNGIATATAAGAGRLVPLPVTPAGMPVACARTVTAAAPRGGVEVGSGTACLVHHFGYQAQDDSVVPGQPPPSRRSMGDLPRMRQDEFAG